MEKMEGLSSPAAFVEGGTQDACEDSCSICLEAFSISDPSTLTCCKHEFHLQCILEWCQRSSQCPMCWQPISLQDPTSQELLQAVEKERILRSHRRAVLIHPVLRDVDLATESAELDERILQRLAAAAMSDRALEIARRQLQSDNSDGNNYVSLSDSINNYSSANQNASSNRLIIGQRTPLSPNRTPPVQTSRSNNRNLSGQSTPVSNEGPTDLQSFSESLKSRLNAASNRYKETLKKSTSGWKERIFARKATLSEISSEVKREVNNGITTVSRFMQNLEVKDDNNNNNNQLTMNNVNNSNNNVSNDNDNNNNDNMGVRAHLARVAACDASSSGTCPSSSK
ncbi:hypothetical protein LUZ60_001513 [Juncus effusus]|nr:hypothetical protein LUZ60_001513 [Juncus effusus]